MEHIPRRGRLPTEPGPYCSEIGHTSPLISSPVKSPPYNSVGMDSSDDNSCKCMLFYLYGILIIITIFSCDYLKDCDIDSLHSNYVVLCPLPEVHLIFMMLQELIFFHLQVVGCHYYCPFLLLFIMLVVAVRVEHGTP